MRLWVLFFCLSGLISFNVYAEFVRLPGLEKQKFRHLVVVAGNPDIVYAASSNSLFQSKDAGQTFKRLAVFKAESIQALYLDPVDWQVYLATSKKVYLVKEQLEKIFTVADEEDILALVRHQDALYVGTTKKCYRAALNGLHWQPTGFKSETTVCAFASNQQQLFLATSQGIYQQTDSDNFSRLFLLRAEQSEAETRLKIYCLALAGAAANQLYLGTSQGLYFSVDQGKNWQKLFRENLDNLEIYGLLVVGEQANKIYLATDSGGYQLIFENEQIRSEKFESNIQPVYQLASSSSGQLYLAASAGLFKNSNILGLTAPVSLEQLILGEPSIEELQAAALNYNEVTPNKIKQWRKAAAVRAIFPKLSLAYDKTIYGSYSASSVSNSGYGDAITGPRDWGVNLSWDLSELVFSSAQDDIDTRARLNTQLRMDIIDELNRVYFERLRVKQETFNSKLSFNELQQKKLRLQELTAILDGYTGGYFSQVTKNKIR